MKNAVRPSPSPPTILNPLSEFTKNTGFPTWAIWALVVVLIVIVLAAIISTMPAKLQRSKAARRPLTEQKEWRTEFLKSITEIVGFDTGTSGRSVRIGALQKKLQWPAGKFNLVLDDVREKNLVRDSHAFKAWGVSENVGLIFGGLRLQLTSTGKDELFEVEKGRETPHLAPMHVTYKIKGGKKHAFSVLGDASTGDHAGVDLKDLQIFLEAYAETLTKFPDATGYREHRYQEELHRIEAELDSPSPRPAVIEQAGQTLRALAEGVAGNALFAALVVMAKNLGF